MGTYRVTGDTIAVLSTGEAYNSGSKLQKVSLAPARSPRVGNERLGKPDEPYALEYKDTIAVGKRLDVGKVLVSEGLVITQHHRDDEEKSPRYGSLVAVEL